MTVGTSGLAELLGEIGDLKRVRAAGSGGRSVAETSFARAWGRIAAREDPVRVAREEAAVAVASARLGAIDATVLLRAGLAPAEAREVLLRSFDEAAPAVAEPLRGELRALLGRPVRSAEPPAFVAALTAQPRAGATAPGRPRLIVEPPESHADHCWAVAVGAVLLGSEYGAEPGAPFLAGLAHHLHNVALPDSGFSGEELLGDHLGPVLVRLRHQSLEYLRTGVREPVAAALGLLDHADTPEARAFHAADVLDRVLQMRHHARAAAFTLDDALKDMDLIHAGPLQEFGLRVAAEAGLR